MILQLNRADDPDPAGRKRAEICVPVDALQRPLTPTDSSAESSKPAWLGSIAPAQRYAQGPITQPLPVTKSQLLSEAQLLNATQPNNGSQQLNAAQLSHEPLRARAQPESEQCGAGAALGA